MNTSSNNYVGYIVAISLFLFIPQTSLAENMEFQKAGKEYKPSYKECVKALENGIVMPRDGSAVVFYKNAGYIIATTSEFYCIAFRYK